MTAEQIEVIKKTGLAKSSSELEILFPEFDKAFKCEPFI